MGENKITTPNSLGLKAGDVFNFNKKNGMV
jgi:hypothetical protein